LDEFEETMFLLNKIRTLPLAKGNILKEEDFRDWFPGCRRISRKRDIIPDKEGIEERKKLHNDSL